MTSEYVKAQDVIDTLDKILEQERDALMSGDLDAIPKLLEQKEALFDQLQDVRVEERGHLEVLHSKVTRNQALLDSALRGIRSVSERMATLRRVRKTLETYDSAGRKMTFESNPEHKVEKRA
jgi:flagellar biosynthesis/type III secretory pathway chaperone